MTPILIVLLVLLLVLAAVAGYFLFRKPLTDQPPRPEGLTPEMREQLGVVARRCDLGREIAGDMSQVDGAALWSAYRERITDRAQRRCLEQDLNGCLGYKAPLRRVYCPEEYREETAALPSVRGQYRPFRPMSIHSTVKTQYIRFYLEEHNQQLLSPPVYHPVILTLEQQAVYLEKVRHRVSHAAGIARKLSETTDERMLKVVYAAWSMGNRPTREMREAANLLLPGHAKDYFFMAVAMRQWFLLLRQTISDQLGILLADYDQRRRTLVSRIRAQEALSKALEKKPMPEDIRILYRYRVVREGHSAECDALIISTSGIYPVEARSFGAGETFPVDKATAPGLLRSVFLWDYFRPALEELAPGVGSNIIHPILALAGRAPFQNNSACTVLRPDGIRDFIASRKEVFPAELLDELVEMFRSQGARPSTYALPDYEAVMDQLEGGIYKEYRRLIRVADGLPHRTIQKTKEKKPSGEANTPVARAKQAS